MKPTLILTCVLLLIGITSQAQVNNQAVDNQVLSESRKRVETKKNIVKLVSRKEKDVMIIKSHRPFDVQFYIFDLEGTILHQGVLKSKQKTRVENLTKGTYTYSIFHNDVSVEEGQLIIK